MSYTLVVKMRGKVTKMRIPLDELSEKEREKIEEYRGKNTIYIADEPCLTCGHKKRLQRVERTNGKRELVRVCLYCLADHHTKANREGV